MRALVPDPAIPAPSFVRRAVVAAAAFAAAVGLAAAPAMAGGAHQGVEGPRPVVLELFVSQNCAACPPANDALAGLAATRDVLPLTYDVDYWDYLGWRDTLAHPDFTQRQRDYADRFGQARVYTPQIVVDGREAGPGGDGARIEADIKICREKADAPPHLKARREGNHVSIELGEGAAPPEGADIWLIGYQPGHVTTPISGGENAGRDFTVVNPVRQVSRIGEWRGEKTRWSVKAPDSPAFAVLVQHRGAGPILAAAKGH